jgi:hypothetical protein
MKGGWTTEYNAVCATNLSEIIQFIHELHLTVSGQQVHTSLVAVQTCELMDFPNLISKLGNVEVQSAVKAGKS